MSSKTRVDTIIETLCDYKGEKLTARELAKSEKKHGIISQGLSMLMAEKLLSFIRFF